MKVGDLVIVVQSETDGLACAFVGQVGVIIEAQLGKFKNQDSFSVAIRDRILTLGANYLRSIDRE